jgi:hypothetical protein
VSEMPAWKHSVNGPATAERRAVGPQLPASPTNWRRLDAPFFYAANAQILISGNSATLLFTRPHPAILPDGNIAPTPLREAVALVEMSLDALKDLAKAAADVIRQIEERNADAQTSATQSREAASEPPLNGVGAE